MRRPHPMMVPRGRKGFGQIATSGGNYTMSPDGNVLVPANSVVLTPDQFANINSENYTQGQLDSGMSVSSPLSSLPSWVLPAALILGGLVLFKSFSK